MSNDTNVRETTEKEFNLRDVFLLIKRHIALFLSIILAVFAVGVIYAYVIDVDCTVTQKIAYRCEGLPFEDKNGNLVNTSNTTSNIDMMRLYGGTIVDLLDEGVVLDRANFYYQEYINKKEVSQKEADEYLAMLEEKANANEKETSYIPLTDPDKQLNYITKSNITTSILSTEAEDLFVFNVNFKDKTEETAKEKLAVLLCAFAFECNEAVEIEGEDVVKYFGEFETTISDLGIEAVSASSSKIKIFAVALATGIGVSLIVIYIIDRIQKYKKQVKNQTVVDAPVQEEKTEE